MTDSLSELELELASKNAGLRAALSAALDFIDRHFDPVPESIKNHRQRLKEEDKTVDAALDNCEDFAAVISRMARLMAMSNRLSAFGPDSLGMAEWISLRTIRLQPDLTDHQLCREIGATRKRTQAILSHLRARGYVELRPHAAGANHIVLQPSAEAAIAEVDALLAPTLADILSNSPLRLRVMMAGLQKLFRITGKTPDGPDALNASEGPGIPLS